MDLFKTTVGVSKVTTINAKNYELATGKKEPYRQDKNDKISYYAVCPECDNPIQVVGIFKDTIESKRKPYGRHHKGSIPALAVYNEEDYLDCSYSNPNWENKSRYRPITSRVASQTLKILRDQFDRVIYLLSKQTNLKISQKLAEKMLEQYLLEEGWRYREATINNLPWIFGQCSPAFPMFGRWIKKDSELHQAIERKCPNVMCAKVPETDYVQIKHANKEYIEVYFTFVNHQKKVEGEHLIETIDFWIYQDKPIGEDKETILKQTLTIETDYFLNLIQSSRNENYRNKNLLAFAKEHIHLEKE